MTTNKFWLDEDPQTDPFAVTEDQPSEFEKLLQEVGTDNYFTDGKTPAKRFQSGQAITGKVIHQGEDFVFVDLGGKLTGALAVDEYLENNLKPPHIGDECKAFVKQATGSEIVLTLSVKSSGDQSQRDAIGVAYENSMPVDVKIVKANKGGFEGTIGTLKVFIPLGQIDLKIAENHEEYVGQTLRCQIKEFSAGGRNIVCSRKAILLEEAQENKLKVLNTLEVGMTLNGQVSRLAPFGAFVDVGGFDGLVPLRELSLKRISKPEDVVKIGDAVRVHVLQIERTPRLRVTLSLKDQLGPSAEGFSNISSSEDARTPSMFGSLANALEKAQKKKG